MKNIMSLLTCIQLTNICHLSYTYVPCPNGVNIINSTGKNVVDLKTRYICWWALSTDHGEVLAFSLAYSASHSQRI